MKTDSLPEFLAIVRDKMVKKGLEHNTLNVSFRDYCVHGKLSASTLVHREALRVCVESERGDVEKIKEHLVDTAVFCMLMWDYLVNMPEMWSKK